MNSVIDYLKSNVKVIGISGIAGSGKDYIAKEFFINKHGFYNISLAWHFKIQCIAHGEATYEEVFDTKPPHVRHLLQQRGTEEGRHVWGDDIWVNHTFSWMMLFNKDWGIDRFIIPDIRFQNEMENIQKLGGVVYRVIGNSSGRHLTEKAKQHESENSLTDDMDVYDGFIYNDFNPQSNFVDSQVQLIMEDLYA